MNEEDIQRERFIVSESPETVISTPRYEGANSSRFAIAGLLSESTHLGLHGLSDEMFNLGFSERLSVESQRNIIFVDRPEGLSRVRNYFTDFQQLGTLRSATWAQLNEGNIDARIAFLTAGLCSDLERESAAAAVAMIGILAMPSMPSLEDVDFVGEIWNDISLIQYGELYPNSLLKYHFPREIMREISQLTRGWETFDWPFFDVPQLMRILSQLRSVRSIKVLLNDLAWMRVGLAYRCKDEISRQFVDTLNSRPRVWGRHRMVERNGLQVRPVSVRPPLTSTMIHGTWGWKSDWWYPDGSFHKFVKKEIRSKLYDEGQEFSWSGAYSEKDRRIAGDRFRRWVESQEPRNGLGSVFAHSYGAEVVSRAINGGAKVDELVFLSAPVNEHLEEALNHVSHAVDVRLRFDLVLSLAAIFRRPSQSRPRQRFRPNPRLLEFRSRYHYWDHGVTHQKWFWKAEDIANRTHLRRVP